MHTKDTDKNTAYNPELYGDEFFKQWGATNIEYIQSAKVVAEEIYRQYRPKTILDLGCGAGFHSDFLIKMGVEVICADYKECPVELRSPEIQHVEIIDLMEDIPENRFPEVDLVLCLDVAEHLPDSSSDMIVKNCTKFSDLVLFTAAPPGQNGIGHINEQPRSYWIERFNKQGFRYCRKENGWLDRMGLERREELKLRWMMTQMRVFRKGEKFPFPPMKVPFISPDDKKDLP